MCGILGYYSRNGEMALAQDHFSEMLSALGKRGPDEQRIYQHQNVILGHTRLSIIDLSTGTQPIFNEDRSVGCILNGEIYNFHELRERLQRQGHVFTTNSDTEVIVHLYEDEGENVFRHLSGMFAVVLHDAKKGLLLVGRDRLGEKPVLYYDSPRSFWCASELKALAKSPEIGREIDVDAIVGYLRFSYITAPHTVYQKIKKLEPAHYLKVTQGKTEKVRYWNPNASMDSTLSERRICEQTIELLNASVRERMVSDVPIGAFLSGGIDSSAVVAFMSMNSTRPIKTFAVGFEGHANELPYARQVAARYQTDHAELMISPNISDVLAQVVGYYDEPFADSSSIPTYLICKAAREHVKVVLTGDGGDELFAGYARYISQRYYSNSKIISKCLRGLSRLEVKLSGADFMDKFYRFQSHRGAAENWLSLVGYFPFSQLRDLCRFQIKPSLETHGRRHHWLPFNELDPLSEAYAHDYNYYLPDDLLKKVDMASMACGLESRAPFLDHRLVEFSLQIPPEMKIRKNETKYLLKRSLGGILPESILKREKWGFGSPVSSWIRGDLKSLVLDSLAPGCKIERLFFKEGINKVKDRVYREDATERYWCIEDQQLWTLLMLELWMKNYP